MPDFPPKGPGLSTLWHARSRTCVNRLRELDSRQKLTWVLGLILAFGVLLAAGHVAAPSLLIPPLETTAPTGFEARSSQVAGARALDAAFWFSLLIGAIFSFRVMESLFRREEVRRLSLLPVPMSALFLDRVAAGAAEALGWGMGASVFFLPLAWHGGGWAALGCMGVLGMAPMCTLGVGFGVQCFFGDAEFGAKVKGNGQRVSDGYGGAGSAFLFAPGVALALSVVVTLLLKLSFGELIRLQGMTPATQAGLGISLGLGALGLGTSWFYFRRSYFRMLAGFREADVVGFEPPMDYQHSAFDSPRWAERLLGTPGAALVYRRHHLQYGRRFALTRYLYVVLWVGCAVGLGQFSAQALPTWSAVAAVWVVMALVLNPWRRLGSPGLASTATQLWALAPGDEARASQGFALREIAWVIAPPFALAVALGGAWRGEPVGQSVGFGGLVWAGGVAMWGATVAGGPGAAAAAGVREVAVPLGVALALCATMLVSVWWAGGLGVGLGVWGVMVMGGTGGGAGRMLNHRSQG